MTDPCLDLDASNTIAEALADFESAHRIAAVECLKKLAAECKNAPELAQRDTLGILMDSKLAEFAETWNCKECSKFYSALFAELRGAPSKLDPSQPLLVIKCKNDEEQDVMHSALKEQGINTTFRWEDGFLAMPEVKGGVPEMQESISELIKFAQSDNVLG